MAQPDIYNIVSQLVGHKNLSQNTTPRLLIKDLLPIDNAYGFYTSNKVEFYDPIQDQIFIAIKEIAKSRKYDFIFDKSADIVMLYSDRKFDISDQILRIITRTNNRKQLDTRREKREAEEENEILVSNLETDVDKAEEEEDKTDTKKPEKVLSAKELREKMLQERKQKILASRKVKDSTFTKNNDN